MSTKQIDESLSTCLTPLSVNVKKVQSSTTQGRPSCICNRLSQDILCRSCGYIFVGRLRKRCPIHITEIHLMDIQFCPKCKLDCLMEIRERHEGLLTPKKSDGISWEQKDSSVATPTRLDAREKPNKSADGKSKIETPSKYVDHEIQTDFSMKVIEDKLMASSVSLKKTPQREIGLQTDNDTRLFELLNEEGLNKENEILGESQSQAGKNQDGKQEQEWVWGSSNTKNIGISDDYSVLKRALQLRKSSIGQFSDDTLGDRQF